MVVSIQGLILVPEPYYNEPSYEQYRGTEEGQRSSDQVCLSKRTHSIVREHIRSVCLLFFFYECNEPSYEQYQVGGRVHTCAVQ